MQAIADKGVAFNFADNVERNGMEFDYVEELLSSPYNTELEIIRRQSTESATGANQPNTSNKLPSGNSIRNSRPVVNIKKSLSADGQVADIGPVAWQVKGEDVALEDGAKNGEIATSPAAPRNDSSIGDGVALGDIGPVVRNRIEESRHPYGKPSFFYGLSHGLKSVHGHFLPRLTPAPAFRVPSKYKKSRYPKGHLDFLVRRKGLVCIFSRLREKKLRYRRAPTRRATVHRTVAFNVRVPSCLEDKIKRGHPLWVSSFSLGTPKGTRTPDLLIRSAMQGVKRRFLSC